MWVSFVISVTISMELNVFSPEFLRQKNFRSIGLSLLSESQIFCDFNLNGIKIHIIIICSTLFIFSQILDAFSHLIYRLIIFCITFVTYAHTHTSDFCWIFTSFSLFRAEAPISILHHWKQANENKVYTSTVFIFFSPSSCVFRCRRCCQLPASISIWLVLVV